MVYQVCYYAENCIKAYDTYSTSIRVFDSGGFCKYEHVCATFMQPILPAHYRVFATFMQPIFKSALSVVQVSPSP